jgi:hypothetical protein
MTGQAKAPFRGKYFDRLAVHLMTIIAFTIAHRCMHDLPEKFRIFGAVLGVAVSAPVADWVVLVGSNESAAPDFMTGGAQIIAGHDQQAGIVSHVRGMTGEATVCYWGMDSGSCKRLFIVTVEAELFRSCIEQFFMLRVMRIVTGEAFTT